ncbi:phage holin [Staphylococcus saprophyticus]|uniref:phage holin n=1 Tax=Staphylococcus saprophyticus TaxID=29385 RepID=UPI002DBABDAF|nr:phage holin [Staphylococcus saprophyticus]MEB7998939.1 phage holin [Staphylococcus saprophyticus]
MNWKLRFKNKTTLTALIGAVFLFVKQISEIFGFDISEQLEQLSGIIGGVLTILVSLGIIVDGTTKGMKDSGIAQTYSKPRDEQVDPVEYQREGNTFTPKEYDTREDFSDDSDEIEFYSTLADGGQHPDDAKHLEDEEQPEDDTDEGLGQRGVDNGKN